MSGGHYDYAYWRVHDFADACILPRRIYDWEKNEDVEVPVDNLELRQKLAAHLLKVAEIMREVEWCDSGDIGDDDLKESLEKFLETIKE